jgi:nitrite reductase/ring-hydroxylating ferredoxin subunit
MGHTNLPRARGNSVLLRGKATLAPMHVCAHQPAIAAETRMRIPHSLQGDATYLVVLEDQTVEKYGINAVCTHLGCVVPWNKAENKFMCPCHGSQYNAQGKKVRGPAPLVSSQGKCFTLLLQQQLHRHLPSLQSYRLMLQALVSALPSLCPASF